jgi:hypothetical protein
VGSGFKSRGVHGKSSYFSRELDFLLFWTFTPKDQVSNEFYSSFLY